MSELGEGHRMGPDSTGPEVDALAAAVDGLVDDVDGPVAGTELVELCRQRDRLDAAISEQVRRFEAADGHSADGHPTAGSWLRHQCQLGQAEASRWVRTARALRDLPASAAAWLEGRLPSAHAHHIGLAATHHPDTVTEVEGILLDHAQAMDADQFGQLVRKAVEIFEPDDGEERARRAYESRRLSISRVGDQDVVNAAFDLGDGGWLRRLINVYAEREYRADVGLSAAERRSAAQHKADGLVAAAKDLLGGVDVADGARVHPRVTVTIDAETLAGVEPADRFAALAEWLADRERQAPARRRCELDDGTPLPVPVAQRLGCDSTWERMLTATDRRLNMGRAVRTATAAQRRALAVRDGGCVFPGCNRPPEWCEAHHDPPYEEGGLTDVDTMMLYCSHHHHLRHDGGYTVRGSPAHGTVRHYRPDGTLIHPRPLRADPPGQAA